jgi:hypothetical protein
MVQFTLSRIQTTNDCIQPEADLQPAEFRHDENITCLLTIKQIQTLGVQCRQRWQ